jgi:transposase
MSSQRYLPEFKDEAVRQIVDRGRPVPIVAEQLGVSAHSFYKWLKVMKLDKSEENAAELIETKSEILRSTSLSTYFLVTSGPTGLGANI